MKQELLRLSFTQTDKALRKRLAAGATKPTQLEQNARAIAWTLTADERAEIDRITLA